METRHLLAVTKIAHGLYGAIVFTIFDSRSGNQPQACPTREHSLTGKHQGVERESGIALPHAFGMAGSRHAQITILLKQRRETAVCSLSNEATTYGGPGGRRKSFSCEFLLDGRI